MMTDPFKYGIEIGCILGLGGFVIFLMRVILRLLDKSKKERDEREDAHRRERDEMRQEMLRMHEDNRRTIDDNTRAMRDTGGILAGLKTLLENKNR